MTKQKKLELINRFAPILWLHSQDNFFPEDCLVMEQMAKLGRSPADLRDFTLDELGDLDDSQDYYMDLPELDFNNFADDAAYSGTAMGPEALSHLACQKYGNNTFLDPGARWPVPRFYARALEFEVSNNFDPHNMWLEGVHPEIFGDYYVIQYYFFFIYNDAWNQHISDWDALLEIYTKKDHTDTYVIYHMHHKSWLVKLDDQFSDLNDWLADWRQVADNKMGTGFNIADHPFVFIARGAHGGYPTPGYTIHGGGALGKTLLAQTDHREIGKYCVFPAVLNTTEIQTKLDQAGITTDTIQYVPWSEFIFLDKQPWLEYKGRWGPKSEYDGWGGPEGIKQKKFWRMNQRRFKNTFIDAALGLYTNGSIIKILRNWHGWK